MTDTKTVVWRNDPTAALPVRPLGRSLRRGFMCRCPNCGEGKLFRGYLKSAPACSACGEDLSHQRSDDAPPYFTMVVVGHVVVPIILAVQFATDLPAAVYLAVSLPIAAGMTFALLRPIKGATIALQWTLRMHGFDGSTDPDAVPGWAAEHAGKTVVRA